MCEARKVRCTTGVACDEGRRARRRDVREFLFAKRSRHFRKLRAEHAAEAATLGHIGEFAHIAAAGSREDLRKKRRRAAVAVDAAQVAGVMASERGWRGVW
jgi:hypothetical protein